MVYDGRFLFLLTEPAFTQLRNDAHCCIYRFVQRWLVCTTAASYEFLAWLKLIKHSKKFEQPATIWMSTFLETYLFFWCECLVDSHENISLCSVLLLYRCNAFKTTKESDFLSQKQNTLWLNFSLQVVPWEHTLVSSFSPKGMTLQETQYLRTGQKTTLWFVAVCSDVLLLTIYV